MPPSARTACRRSASCRSERPSSRSLALQPAGGVDDRRGPARSRVARASPASRRLEARSTSSLSGMMPSSGIERISSTSSIFSISPRCGARRVVAGEEQVLVDRARPSRPASVLESSRPMMRSESRTEETSGLVTTTATSAWRMASVAPRSMPAGLSQITQSNFSRELGHDPGDALLGQRVLVARLRGGQQSTASRAACRGSAPAAAWRRPGRR